MGPVVIKRDGCRVPYDGQRIKEAVIRACIAVNCKDNAYADLVAQAVSMAFSDRDEVDIHEVQAAVENQLMQGPYKGLARAYIEYRHDRDMIRERKEPPECRNSRLG